MNVKECIIVGGGNSINLGISLGLKEAIGDKFVLYCNYAYRHFKGTALCFGDRDFYYPTQECISNNFSCHPNIHEELRSQALIIGTDTNGVHEFKMPNTLLITPSNEYTCGNNAKKVGFYWGELHQTGIFALSLASFLMNYQGKIYLLGFDWPKRDPKTLNPKRYNPFCDLKTHFYTDIKHRGMGFMSGYECHNPDHYYSHFLQHKDLQIFNVSPKSNIETFNKIDYPTMFSSLSLETFNQNILREEIKLSIK